MSRSRSASLAQKRSTDALDEHAIVGDLEQFFAIDAQDGKGDLEEDFRTEEKEVVDNSERLCAPSMLLI